MKFTTLLAYITPHRGVLWSILGLLMLASGVSLLNPWIAGQFTGLLTGSGASFFTHIHFILMGFFRDLSDAPAGRIGYTG